MHWKISRSLIHYYREAVEQGLLARAPKFRGHMHHGIETSSKRDMERNLIKEVLCWGRYEYYGLCTSIRCRPMKGVVISCT